MKKWRNFAVAAAMVGAAAACSTGNASDERLSIVIDPAVTRASELSFDNGDKIGLTVIKSGEQTPYLSNAQLTCNGSLFIGSGVEWYADRSKNALLRAYYPYTVEGEPSTFTVRSDQRGEGYTMSDFMTSTKSDVAPTSGAVAMIFRHQLAKINIYIKNNTQAFISEAGIISCAVTASVDVAAGSAEAYEPSQKTAIIAHETTPQEKYNAIVAPQTASLIFYVKLDDGSQMRSVAMTETEYAGGKQFTARLTVTDERIDVTLSGQIESWGDNTDLTPDNTGGEQNTPGGDNGDDDDNGGGSGPGDGGGKDGSINWGGVSYPTAVLADGRTWTTQNLRYIPAGKSVSDNPSSDSGVWYPYDSDKQIRKDESFIAEHGYLYSAAVAHGGSVSDGDSPVRGICPEGWHLPTKAELEALRSAYKNLDNIKASAFGIVFGGCINGNGQYFVNPYEPEEFYIWSSSVESGKTYRLLIDSSEYNIQPQNASYGASVRCVKDN